MSEVLLLSWLSGVDAEQSQDVGLWRRGSGMTGGVWCVAGISRSRDRAVKMSLPVGLAGRPA